jgi:hypothetical protein
VTIVSYKNFYLHYLLASLPLAYTVKALCVESEMQSESGCVLFDFAFFFLKFFLKLFSTFFNSKVRVGEGVGTGLSYKNLTLPIVVI